MKRLSRLAGRTNCFDELNGTVVGTMENAFLTIRSSEFVISHEVCFGDLVKARLFQRQAQAPHGLFSIGYK